MINDAICDRRRIAGIDVVHTSGHVGHVLYGPYLAVRPGVYRVSFRLAVTQFDLIAGDPECARIDVAAAYGAAILAQRTLLVSELTGHLQCFTLELTLGEFRTLEFRVAVFGIADLLIDPDPQLERLSEVGTPPPPLSPREASTDPVELHHQVRAVLRRLTPHALADHRKVRLGNIGDGGYICIDEFAGIDTALSFGINDDISWDRDVADRGLTIYQFDHTVDDPAPDDRRMIFEKKMIDVRSGVDRQSLSELIRRHDKGHARPNIILKTDIEGAEWEVLLHTPQEELARIAWIVGEFHYLQGLTEVGYRTLIDSALEKLTQEFTLIHVHANSSGGISNVGNVIFPNVIEATFANRASYRLTETDELFPGPLDIACDPNQPDMFLGSFRF